jgi:hypothetical protein
MGSGVFGYAAQGRSWAFGLNFVFGGPLFHTNYVISVSR